jgi:RNA polymerase sigma factor (sigma-70 family)
MGMDTFAHPLSVEADTVQAGHPCGTLSLNITMPPGHKPSPEDFADLLIAVAKVQDRVAFAGLYRFFAPRVKSFLLRSGLGSGVADELAQETLVTVWRKASSFDPSKASVSTWIYTIARNLRVDHLRRTREVLREQPEANDESDDPSHQHADNAQPSLPDQLSDQLVHAKVRTAIEQLPHEQREVLRLSYYEDQPHAAIAKALDIPLGTVKSRMRLAVTRLRESLEHLKS